MTTISKNPVFVKSMETAVEVATSFGSEKYDKPRIALKDYCNALSTTDCVPYFNYQTSPAKGWTS